MSELSTGTLLLMTIIGAVGIFGFVTLLIVFMDAKRKRNRSISSSGTPTDDPTASDFAIAIRGTAGYLNGLSFPIDGTIIVGRDPSKCAICLPLHTKGISAVHCELSLSGENVSLRDLNSSYGTFTLDGNRLSPDQKVTLKSGDGFYLADGTNKFQIYVRDGGNTSRA